jgi:hypothetical protein
MAAVVGVGMIGASVWAFRVSQRNGFEVEASHEARLQLPVFASGMARCAAGRGSLPETGEWVPARLADVSGKAHLTAAADWADATFACANFELSVEQRLQYRWRQVSTSHGRVEARADFDLNGAPDHWWEVEVTCNQPGQCEAVNFVTEVMEDGVREPPGVLAWLGRSRRYAGEPPSLTADEATPPPAPLSAAAPAPLAAVIGNAPTSLDTLYHEAERRARAHRDGVVLLELEYQGVRDRLLDPATGGALKGLYGAPDGKGFVRAGEELVSVTFDKAGVVVSSQKARRALHAVGFAECLPDELRIALGGDEPWRGTLAWDTERERPLWSVQRGKQPARTFSADRCSAVK